MISYIKGEIADKFPTHIVMDVHGIGYHINISLNTFSQIAEQKQILLHIHEIIREDTHELYGFWSVREREVFRHLISVSGIGANTARMILSSLQVEELEQVIISGNVNVLKSIKGIGLKTAQRVIVDLKDKIGKSASAAEIFTPADNTIKNEALSALVMLGFTRNASEKAIDKVLKTSGNYAVEEVIKLALKQL
ncbi:Holliday junction branch migration protein RuvA [Saccharicrinis sp. FJH62]|uniref:Holliday junction branch migration protein RuvA n=1 Tax=Saccharicrinis sp. FJH62 TaxID=3344657 RepID=UPI0035D4CB85